MANDNTVSMANNNIEDFLRKTKERRQSMPRKDAPSGKDDAATPLDICSIAQLHYWVKHDPQELLNVLDLLRVERDESLGYIQDWKTNNDRYESEIATHEQHATSQNVLIHALRVQLSSTRTEKANLSMVLNKIETDQLSSSNHDDVPISQAGHVVTPVSSSLVTPSGTDSESLKKRLSTKFPDPPVFTDGMDPTWDSWSLKIRNKLTANADHYPTTVLKLAYVRTRIAGQAESHLWARSLEDAKTPYLSFKDVLDHLAEYYDDPFRAAHDETQFRSLVQGTNPFNIFWSQFARLSASLDWNEKSLMSSLHQKVNKRLRQTIHQDFNSLHELRSYLSREDNRMRYDYELDKDSKPVKDKETPVSKRKTEFVQVNNPVIARGTSRALVSLPPKSNVFARQQDIDTGNCFICHKSGHISVDCPDKAAAIAKGGPLAVKINELQTNYDPPQDGTTSSDEEDDENDGNESGNA